MAVGLGAVIEVAVATTRGAAKGVLVGAWVVSAGVLVVDAKGAASSDPPQLVAANTPLLPQLQLPSDQPPRGSAANSPVAEGSQPGKPLYYFLSIKNCSRPDLPVNAPSRRKAA